MPDAIDVYLNTIFRPTSISIREPSLAASREDALERDAEIQNQVRHQIVMREIAPGRPNRVRIHYAKVAIDRQKYISTAAPADGLRRRRQFAVRRHHFRHQAVGVKGHLRLQKSDALFAADFAEVVDGPTRARLIATDMQGHAILQIRQCKGALAISPVKRPEQREKCCVLRERQELPIAKSPSRWSKVERENANFGDKWVGHGGRN